MITHRHATRASAEPPVRFYKTIAITFLLVTIVLLGVVIFFTSKKATITLTAKDDIKTVNFTLASASEGRSEGVLHAVVTSTVFSWSEKYFPTGNKSIEGIATGEVVIYNKTNGDQPLIGTTRFLTPSGVLFRLTNRVLVPANGQITAEVYADQAGSASDIGPSQFTIPGLNAEKQKVIYAESKKPMTGGVRKVGVITDSDLQAAETDYVNKVRAAAGSTVSSTEVWVNQKLVSVAGYRASANRKVGEEVSEFTLSGTSSVIMVFYNRDELVELINQKLDSQIDQTIEKVVFGDREPQMALAAYDLAKGTAQLAVTQDILTTLEVNADKLADVNFFGKSKDEIERYSLGLSHVAGVEVKFSPGWMRTAPSVPDHVKVIVRSVK